MPGISSPERNAIKAPPPELIYENLFLLIFSFSIATEVSPPPKNEDAFDFAIAFKISFVLISPVFFS